MSHSLPEETDAIVRSLAQYYAMQGRKREVALLAQSQADMEEVNYDNWNGGTYTYALNLRAPVALYAALEGDVETLEQEFLDRLTPLLRGYHNEHLGSVVITTEVKHDENWRDNAMKWLDQPDNKTTPQSSDLEYDYFISHASEDKDALVRPLAEGLANNGVRVWYDEFALSIGDSLRQSIDKGLANSRYGIVVLSPAFFAKNWPQYELNGLTTKQMMGQKVILPVWHNIDRDGIAKVSPSLADMLAYVSGSLTPIELVDAFVAFLGRDSASSGT